MTWIEAVPVALVAALWLLLPGLAVSYGIGLRGIAAWAFAPIITVAELATLAVVAAKLEIGWSVPLALVVCLVIALLAVGFGFWRGRQPSEPRPVTSAAFLGLVPAVVAGMVVVWRGIGRPDALSQTYDAIFHLNALAYVIDSRNASSLTLTGLGNPVLPGTFYPAAWHDLVSLVVLSTGTSIPAAANLTSAVIAGLAWPLASVLLVRQIAGPNRLALAGTGVLSLAFPAFPWKLLSFGVLWPNLLGMALAPAGLALVLSLCGLADRDVIGRRRAWWLLPVAVLAFGLAHPNVVFSLIALAVFPVAHALLRRARRLRSVRGWLEVGLAVLVFAGGWAWAATTPLFAPVRQMYWKPVERPARAVGEVLLNATDQGPQLWALSVLVLLGIVLCLRTRARWWLVGGYLVTLALFVLTAALNRPGTEWITGYWYNDPYRLAAMVPITAVPLTVLACAWLAERARGRAGRAYPVLVVVGALLLVVLSNGLSVPASADVIAQRYDDRPGTALVDPAERAFFARVGPEIPAGSLVAGNPWDGSVLLWALDDRKTLIPHVGIALSTQQRYLTQHLIDLATDPKVCPMVRQWHVGYLVVAHGSRRWLRMPGANTYPGFADPGSRPGFQLVDSDGSDKLYRITGCIG